MSSKKNREDIEQLYDYDLYVPSRTLYIGSVHTDIDGEESGTDASMFERAMKGLHILEQQAPDGDKPITIITNNLGGDYHHGMAIYDIIRACKNHVRIIGYGHVMSMGSVIFQAGDERVLAKNAKQMIHYGQTSLGWDHPKINQRWVEQMGKDNEKMEEIYLEKIKTKHPDYTLKQLRKMLEFDTILDAKQSVELGLADKILGEDDV